MVYTALVGGNASKRRSKLNPVSNQSLQRHFLRMFEAKDVKLDGPYVRY
jgi:hypothetical protein